MKSYLSQGISHLISAEDVEDIRKEIENDAMFPDCLKAELTAIPNESEYNN